MMSDGTDLKKERERKRNNVTEVKLMQPPFLR